MSVKEESWLLESYQEGIEDLFEYFDVDLKKNEINVSGVCNVRWHTEEDNRGGSVCVLKVNGEWGVYDWFFLQKDINR